MTTLEQLNQTDIFKGLRSDQLNMILPGCEEQSCQIGSKLFSEGDLADHLCVVTSGQVDLRFDLPGRSSSPENTLLTIGAGQASGWSSFVPPYRYKLSAYCATDTCTVLMIKRAFLDDLFLRDAGMGYRVLSNLTSTASLRQQQLQESGKQLPVATVSITVHMATCGIAAGAREVMVALMDELAQLDRKDIQIKRGGCIGHCKKEPNVTVVISGEDPVIYQKMNKEKMRQVFREHVLKGDIQTDFVLDKE